MEIYCGGDTFLKRCFVSFAMAVHIYKVEIKPADLDYSKKMVMWDAPLRWYFEAHKAFFSERGIDFGALAERGYSLVVAEDKHTRRFPIKAESRPEVISRLESMARSDLYFVQAVKVDDDIAVKSKVTLVLLSAKFESEIPRDIREKLES